MPVHSPDDCVPVADAYPIYTIGRLVSGVFTATTHQQKATHVLMRPTTAANEVATCTPFSEGMNVPMQIATSITLGADLYQATGGKVGTSSADSALAIGKARFAATKVSGSNNHADVLVVR